MDFALRLEDTDGYKKITSWTLKYGLQDTFTVTGEAQVECNTCCKRLTCLKTSHLLEHIQTKTHIGKENGSPPDTFNMDLCEAFIAANIPLEKLNNQNMKAFLTKYTKKHIPHPSTLRKYYIPKIHTKIMNTIATKVDNNSNVWVSADETTDLLGRNIVNVVLGILDVKQYSKSFLIATKVTNKVNAESVAEIINKSLSEIFPNEQLKHDRVLLFLSDAAAYMLKAGKLLKNIYPRLLHVTCVAHALHRICEFIREEFVNVDKFISLVKNIFLKAPLRIRIYKEHCPFLPLPPEPVITRWGTWLQASLFYAENFDAITKVIQHLSNDAKSIIDCKELLQTTSLKDHLLFIQTNFTHLVEGIKYFEQSGVKLSESIEKLNETVSKLRTVPGEISERLNDKIDAIFDRNPDLKIMQQLCLKNDLTTEKYKLYTNCFTYAPLTSCDVERTFSAFKDILTSKRTSITFENLEAVVMAYCNKDLMLNTCP